MTAIVELEIQELVLTGVMDARGEMVAEVLREAIAARLRDGRLGHAKSVDLDVVDGGVLRLRNGTPRELTAGIAAIVARSVVP